MYDRVITINSHYSKVPSTGTAVLLGSNLLCPPLLITDKVYVRTYELSNLKNCLLKSHLFY